MKIKHILLFIMLTISIKGYTQKNITNRSFDDVTFRLDRIATDSTDFLKIPLMLANKYGSESYKTLHIDRQIAELARLRASQIDHCNYCVIFHSKAALDAGISQPKVFALSSWQQSDLFTEEEKAALAYTEALTKVNESAIEDAYQRLEKLEFTNVEKEELTMVVILMNVYSRLFLAQGKVSIHK